jgi:ectoine hydroxylase-related dioxygenase (phytanoyl-CoA dioxygenase family)
MRPDETKPHGYCAANSVVKNQLLQEQIKEQAQEIQMLKDTDVVSLRESDSPDLSNSLKSMSAARQKIMQDVNDVSALAHSTMVKATLRESPDGLQAVVHQDELGEAQEYMGLGKKSDVTGW